MLIELRVKDFAVIDEVALDFGTGLIALTGETGAGKSIVVDALSLLLGERASTDVVRSGADRALVEGVFDVSAVPALLHDLEVLGLPAEDGLLILRREIAAHGRSRAWVNGSPATVSAMSGLAEMLADLHSQHEHQHLLRKGEQRRILDAFAGATDLADEVAKLHGRRTELIQERAARLERRRELVGRADFLRFQRDEIHGARIRADEEQVLEIEAQRLGHAEELATEASSLHNALYEGDGAASDLVASALERLRRLARVDPALTQLCEQLEEGYHRLAEVGRDLGDYARGVEHDPRRLEEIQVRLDQLAHLKRKYGATLDEVIETGLRVERELDELDGYEIEVADLESRLDAVETELSAKAGKLTRERAGAARRLSKRVQDTLPGLGLPGATFQMLLEHREDVGPGGAETVEFRASLNQGFEPKPLARIASGGELSRVMLALKSVLIDVDPVPTLVFDEVDAGVGGTVATFVADRLAEVAERRQVFVITHLAQVASRATHHFRVEKKAQGDRASSEVVLLSDGARVEEIARMLGGDPHSQASQAHAVELLTTR